MNRKLPSFGAAIVTFLIMVSISCQGTKPNNLENVHDSPSPGITQTTAVAGDTAAYKRFSFASGGDYHPEGFGEWRVTLNADGTLAMTHQRAEAVNEYGPFTLSKVENQELWALIAAANIESLPETFTRLGIPDETAYTFALYGRNQPTAVEMWTADAEQNPALLALTDQIILLIEAYSGEEWGG